ncbi:epoxyqueuosine reductase QueH [Chloroflexota bacterium]
MLLHSCCGPCATYCVDSMQKQGHIVSAYWYNPNVHPFMEHKRRLEAMQQLSELTGLPLMVSDGYEIIEFMQAIAGREADRCPVCYKMRLEQTAKTARKNCFDAFTTTLLISPYQNHEQIVEIARDIAQKVGVDFYYEDFRPGFREGHRISKEMGLYHQPYCGCVYSEWERYAKFKIGK